MDKEKLNQLKALLEMTNPEDGIAIVDIHKMTNFSYSTIKKYVEEWGFKIVKKRVKRYNTVDVVVRKGDGNGN